MGHKGSTGKTMKNALHVQRYDKRAEATSNSEKIKPVAFTIVELCKSEGIKQAGSHSLENSVQKIP